MTEKEIIGSGIATTPAGVEGAEDGVGVVLVVYLGDPRVFEEEEVTIPVSITWNIWYVLL